MTKIEFKSLVDTHFTSKMIEIGWHGTYTSLRKTDTEYGVKTFGITKYVSQNLFLASIGIDFNVYHKYAIKKTISLKNSNCLFTNALTPNSITDLAYEWEFNQDTDYNIHLIETLWQAMHTQSPVFYKNFDNFPEPFDKISPSEFENGNEVKLLNTYYVSNQVGFMHLLKNVNLLIGNQTIAKQFSEIAIARLETSLNAQKTTHKSIEKGVRAWIKALEI